MDVAQRRQNLVLAVGSCLSISTMSFAQAPSDPVLKGTIERLEGEGWKFPWENTRETGGGMRLPLLVSTGPDVIVGALVNSGLGDTNETISPVATVGTIRAYGIGTVSCNIGDTNLLWDDNSARKPVIAQNIYRLKNGRFEQIGQSWLKHGFFALTQSLCGTCNGTGDWVLGVGCADTYSASLNRGNPDASGLGPRYEVNPFTGRYNWPIQTTTSVAPLVNTTYRRLRVNTSDLADGSTAGVYYFSEGIYVTPDDAAFGNGFNNASYRRITVNPTSGVLTFTSSNPVHRTVPAIYAWQDFGGSGGTSNPSIIITSLTAGSSFNPGPWQVLNNVAPGGNYYLPNPPTGDGVLYLGSLATDNGDGTWHYEYALYNLNSDRMGGSLSIPIPMGATITNAAWRGIDAHSGVASEDATRNAAWTTNVGASSVDWASPVAYDPANPTLGNAVRWGTMYNFRFDSNVPPVNTGTATVGFYKPGDPASVTGVAWIPDPTWTIAVPPCYANCDGSTDSPVLSANDFTCFLAKFRAGDLYANCDGSTDAPVLSANDFTCFLVQFRAGCP